MISLIKGITMISIVGIVITFVMVFGGYLAAGGKMMIILKSLPFEMAMIGGAAVGAFLLANDSHTVKQSMSDMKLCFKGPQKVKDDYINLLCCLFELVKTARISPLTIESHIEMPNESSIFSKYPTVLNDHFAIALICDYMRMIGMSVDDPHQIEDLIESELEFHHHETLHSSHALQVMSDGLPALGIVAAVLGVIKTMGSIDQPPAVLGKMIGGALVGTFLGVFLSYAIVAPMSSKMKAIADADHQFYALIKNVFIAYLNKYQPTTCIETARKKVPESFRPNFTDLEEMLKGLKDKAA